MPYLYNIAQSIRQPFLACIDIKIFPCEVLTKDSHVTFPLSDTHQLPSTSSSKGKGTQVQAISVTELHLIKASDPTLSHIYS